MKLYANGAKTHFSGVFVPFSLNNNLSGQEINLRKKKNAHYCSLDTYSKFPPLRG
jgi:hypothetical protein